MRFFVYPKKRSFVFAWVLFFSWSTEETSAITKGSSLHRQLDKNFSISSSGTTAAKTPTCVVLSEIQFQRQLLLTVQGRPGDVSNSDISLLQSSLIKTYNKLASCSNGAGLRLSKVNLQRNKINSYGASITPTASDKVTQQFTWIVTAKGSGRGSQPSPLRLVSSGNPSLPKGSNKRRQLQQQQQQQQQRQRRLQQDSSSPTSSDILFNRGGAAGRQKKPKGEGQPKTVVTLCQCPLPTKQNLLKAWNKLFKEPSNSIDTIVNMNELNSYTPCDPVVTNFETTLTVNFGGVVEASNGTTDLATQYVLLEQAILQTYNNINALNVGNFCDPFFLIITNVTLTAAPENGYGLTGLNRRRRRRLVDSTTTTTPTGGYTFNVTGSCHGCSGDLPPLFANETSPSRRLLNRKQRYIVEQRNNAYHHGVSAPAPPFQNRRREPEIDGVCYCPVGATDFRGPTQNEFFQALNQRLGLLGPQGAGLITIVDTAQDSFQVVPVNCSSSIDFFVSIITIDLTFDDGNSTVSSEDGDVLGQSLLESYNGLAQQFCDPLFRSIDSVQLMDVALSRRRCRTLNDKPWLPFLDFNHRRRRRELVQYNRTVFNRTAVKVTLIFNVRGRCRGCPQKTPLFNDGTRRKLGETFRASSTTTTTSRPPPPTISNVSTFAIDSDQLHNVHSSSRRRLQQDSNQTVQCFCSVNSLADRAPNSDEFLTVYNETVTTLNTTLTVDTVNETTTFPPTLSPITSTAAPSNPTTPSPSLKPSQKPTRPRRPSGAPPLTRMPSVIITSPPSKKPSKSPTPSPSRRPTQLPTMAPSNPLSISPTPLPTKSPTLAPANGPQELPTSPPKSPTEEPTLAPPPNPEPTLGPISQPTARPTSQPSVVPKQPTQLPSTLPLTPQPTTPPAQGPTPPPTALPMLQATPPPTALPTLQPTPPPTALPTLQPTPPPTALPTLQPTLQPTPLPPPPPTEPPPTPLPSPPPTKPPTLLPTALQTLQPTPPPPTALPTPPLTALPTLQPTLPPTPLPTPPPTELPTPPPTEPPMRQPTQPPSLPPTPLPTPLPTPTLVRPTRRPQAPFSIFPIVPVFFPSFVIPTSAPR